MDCSTAFLNSWSRAKALVCLLLCAGGAAWAGGPGPAQDAHVEAHWAYMGIEGPEHWGMLGSAYMECESGSHQSPIDISMPRHAQRQEQLTLHYQPSRAQILNTGHTIQVNLQPGNVLHLNGRAYRLRQFHFHEPSEHHVAGVTYSMELHLVHQDARGHVAVVAVLMTLGTQHLALAEVWERFPTQVGSVAIATVVNVKDLLPNSLYHYSYHGSLTTPPCTEGVQWIVLGEPIYLSSDQIQQFVSIIGHNARSTQPLHGRKVEEN